MRRTATVVVALAVVALAASLAAVSSSAATGKAQATTLTVWVGWSARELNEFKKVVAEYDAEEPERLRQGRGRDQRRQDHRGAPLGQRARRRQLVHVVERRDLLLVRRLDRPRPVSEEGRHLDEHLPGGDDVLHPVQGHAVCPAAPGRRLRLLLQQGALQEGRPHAAAGDPPGADAVREEADDAKGRRLARRRRLRPGVRLLPERDRRIPAARRREVLRPRRASRRSRATPPGRRCSTGRRA